MREHYGMRIGSTPTACVVDKDSPLLLLNATPPPCALLLVVLRAADKWEELLREVGDLGWSWNVCGALF